MTVCERTTETKLREALQLVSAISPEEVEKEIAATCQQLERAREHLVLLRRIAKLVGTSKPVAKVSKKARNLAKLLAGKSGGMLALSAAAQALGCSTQSISVIAKRNPALFRLDKFGVSVLASGLDLIV